MIKFINGLLPKRIQDENGFWQAALPFLISAGSSLLGGALNKNKDDNELEFKEQPESPEVSGARSQWYKAVQDFGGQPGYGAIAPNWGDIWSQAQQRVRDYFGGTPTMTGAADRVRASAARRNVSDSPAIEAELSKLGAEEGRILGDIASNQSLAEAQFAESGRQSWLGNLKDISGLGAKQGQFYTPEKQLGIGDMIAQVGGAAGDALTQYNQRKWYEDLLKKYPGA